MRSRKLPFEIVQKDWEKANKHAEEFKKLFGKNFIPVSNNDDFDTLKKKTNALYSKMLTWTSSFLVTNLLLSGKRECY